MLFRIGILVGCIFNSVYGTTPVEFYEDLINQRITAAKHYEVPESNAEFREGANSPDITDIGNYDFIIVGSGSAGGVLATRLSEITQWNILLLEAGGEEDEFNNIPNMFMYLQFSEINWGYSTTPQRNCCQGMKGKRCMAPRGKVIGGSSALNAVLYCRGNAKDYDNWVELGNPGWSYKEVLPYFLKSENSQIDGDPGYHGTGGFWNVEYTHPSSDLFSYFIEANKELNQSLVDYNGKQEEGVAKIQYNIRHGKRQSTGTAFLDNARRRKNLKVVTKALVTKININERAKSAEEVIFIHANKKFIARATKEVLVSGGAINSPQLLMLSGIGPKKHLEEVGIKVIQDLPVGKNLLEHPNFQGISFRTNYSPPTSNLKEQLHQYFNGYGPLSIAGNIDGHGFIQTNNKSQVPTIQYIFVAPGSSPVSIFDRVFNFDETLTEHYLKKINSDTDIIFFLVLLHPKSKGRITLKSSDPIDFPNIDYNLWSEEEDIDTVIEGINFLLKLAETQAFKKINATLIDLPICQEFEKYSKSFWRCAIRHMAVTLFHPCGTTAMGPDPATSVVDTNLKVHGIKKLRVVDAGVFPSTISGNTAAPTVMVAEKISDVIKHYYQVGKYVSPFLSSHYKDEESCYRNEDCNKN